MSIIGLDVGTSSIKAAAYGGDGSLLAAERASLSPKRPQSGWETLNPEESWRATCWVLNQLAAHPSVRHDPPTSLAISASGDEVFPVDRNGIALDACLLSGDLRGDAIEAETLKLASPETWVKECGHVPERMDPINRILWWRSQRPEIFQRTVQFLGWHEFLTFRLCRRAVTDPSLASKWLVYDLKTRTWSSEWLERLGLDVALLPEISPWESPLATLLPEAAAETGLPEGLEVFPGAFDSTCAAVGAGVSTPHHAGLAWGSWQVLAAIVQSLPTPEKTAAAGFPITPYPGRDKFAFLSQSPNGTSVLDWLARSSGVEISELEKQLPPPETGFAPVLSLPHFSGAINPWSAEGRSSRGGFLGLTLATAPADLYRSVLESEVYELVISLESLRTLGVAPDILRATGGGSRSRWWMQLTADLTGLVVEVADVPEAGTLGAARLAGLATDTAINSLHRHEPNPGRAEIYSGRLDLYRAAVTGCLPFTRGLD